MMKSVLGKIYKSPPAVELRDRLGSVRKDLFLGKTVPDFYDRRKNLPLNEKKVLFVEYRSSSLSGNYILIWQWLKKHTDMELHFHNLNQGFAHHREYAARCFKLLEDMATAKYVFVDEPNEVISALALRPETRVIQTWHACGAFKKWGMSTAEKGFGANARKLKKHPNYRNLSMVTVSSPEVVWAYAEAMDLKESEEIILPTGVSRTDVFFSGKRRAGASQKLRELFPESEGKKVILYAPTFRGKVYEACSPEEMDLDEMQSRLGDRYVLVMKHHPYVRKRPVIPQRCASFAKDLTDGMDIADLMMAGDLLITDYSSVIFEYSLMERPMLFFAYDLESMDSFRGFYYSYEEMTPGPVVKNTGEIIRQIECIEKKFDPARVRQFREKFMRSCDGHSTERILKRVLGREG